MIIEKDRVVAFNYNLTEVGNTEVIDSNIGGEPLEFIVGRGHIIPGLESQMMGLGINAKGDFLVNAKDAYGEYNNEALQNLPKEQFAGVDLSVGLVLYGQGEQGETVQVTVKTVNEDDVTVDFNHPLAGKNLMFAVSVAGVREATAEELANGQVEREEQCGTDGGGSCGCGH